MKKIIVIGCPGAGKSTFSRELAAKLALPLFYLDMIWHRPDKSNIGREAFVRELERIVSKEEWIMDGNYLSTMPMRLSHCDTVFFFDLPLELCLEGALSRIGKPREDMPWQESEIDPEFYQWILDFPKTQLPEIRRLLSSCSQGQRVVRFTSREEADGFIETL